MSVVGSVRDTAYQYQRGAVLPLPSRHQEPGLRASWRGLFQKPRRLLLAEPIDRKCVRIDLETGAECAAALGLDDGDSGGTACAQIIGRCLGGVRHGALHTRLRR